MCKETGTHIDRIADSLAHSLRLVYSVQYMAIKMFVLDIENFHTQPHTTALVHTEKQRCVEQLKQPEK